jgi:hypothetical protein
MSIGVEGRKDLLPAAVFYYILYLSYIPFYVAGTRPCMREVIACMLYVYSSVDKMSGV